MKHYRMATGFNKETGKTTYGVTSEIELRQMFHQVQTEYKGKDKRKRKPSYVTKTYDEFINVLTADGILKGTTMSY